VRVPVQIIRSDTKEPVDAELFDEVTLEHFLETQQAWRPLVIQAGLQLHQMGAIDSVPHHWHWDWTTKEADLRVLAFTFFGLRCENELQGLMKLVTAGHVGRHPDEKGKPLVYVDYVETAPWNVKPLMEPLGKSARFGAVGTRLIEAAVRKSLEEGFKGRVGLHSLSTSEPFYIKVCGMTPVARDPAKQDLLWCEFTPEQANRFLS
jgi:hypothetical protein